MVNAVVKLVGRYNGHSVKSNGSVDLSLKADYSELANAVQLLQMLSNDVKISVKMPDDKSPMKIGSFRIKQVAIDHDGEARLSFNSITDYVETDNINRMVTSELFKVRCEADIEVEEDDEDEGAGEDA